MTALPGNSPPNALKRPAGWGREESLMPKRPRSGASPNEMTYHSAFYTSRRGSVDFASRTTHSPRTIELAPLSAYPRHESPIVTGRPPHALPSPSPTVYPQSAAPSLVPQIGHIAGSPASSLRPSASIFTAPASSAMSAHIADLQHQVTLKSLAHQSLQSEYSTLLQKVQHERVRNQAIEKKTYVADNELNELMGKNEDLVEQVKALESQVEDIEEKRDAERAQASRDKEQWGRMLEMGGRLHAKNAEDRLRLLDEKDDLLKRVAATEEGESKICLPNMEDTLASRPESVHLGPRDLIPTLEQGSDARVSRMANESNNEATLEQANRSLRANIELLRHHLRAAKRHNQDMLASVKDMSQSSNDMGDAIDRALEDGGQSSKDTERCGDEESREFLAGVDPSAAIELTLSSCARLNTVHDSFRELPNLSGQRSAPPGPVGKALPYVRPSAAGAVRSASAGVLGLDSHVRRLGSPAGTPTTPLGPVPSMQGPWQYGTGRYIPHNEWMMAASEPRDTDSHAGRFRSHVSLCTSVPSPYGTTDGTTQKLEPAARSRQASPVSNRDLNESPASTSGSKPCSSNPSSSGTTPNALSDDAKPQPSGSHPDVGQLRGFPEVLGTYTNAANFRPWDHVKRPVMPPPPRPFML